MRAVVLAGGEGTRLRPLTSHLPKPFVRISGKPTIEYVLDSLARVGVREVFLATHYRPSTFVERLGGGERFGMRIYYSVEDVPLGTAGAVKRCEPFLESTFLVASGDVLSDLDLSHLLHEHRRLQSEATIALTSVPDPSEFGIVGIDDRRRIVRFKEKPKPEETFSNLVNAGIYVLEPEVLELIPRSLPFDFARNLFPRMLEEKRRLHGVPLEGFWKDVGRPSDVLSASRELGSRRGGGAFVDRAEVHPTSFIVESDLYPGSVVGEKARVVSSILYDGSIVQRGGSVFRSILCEGAVVEEGATLEECVVGPGSRIKANVRICGERIEGGREVG